MSLLLGYYGADPVNHEHLVQVLRHLGNTAPITTLLSERLAIASPAPDQRKPDGSGGTLVGSTDGQALLARLAARGLGALQEDTADGQYALAWYDAPTGVLTLAHDPFGAQRLFHAQIGQTRWFTNQLRALLALPLFRAHRELDLIALHTYLAFSFVAAPRTLLQGIAVVPPNAALHFATPTAPPTTTPLLAPRSPDLPALSSDAPEATWRARWLAEFDGAMARHTAEPRGMGVLLSGGLDSGAVAASLARAGRSPRLFHLDFGPPYDSERPFAEQTATWLGLPLVRVPVQPRRWDAGRALRRLVWQMGEPWGDPVTLPLALGYAAVAAQGLGTVTNGEGGDQLFAGWPNRAMLAGELYAVEGDAWEAGRLDRYLQTFHHFHGHEAALYGPAMRHQGSAELLRAEVRRYLEEPALPALFDRLRWANYWLKGSQNILPRATTLARAAGLDLRAPLFDRRLARFALTIPADLLLRGTEEKYVVKRALAEARLLPPEVLHRPKRGMGVPVTAWCRGPLRGEINRLLRRLARRDLFQHDYLQRLTRGEETTETLRGTRRDGEKLWQLAILEVWLELFYDATTIEQPG